MMVIWCPVYFLVLANTHTHTHTRNGEVVSNISKLKDAYIYQ